MKKVIKYLQDNGREGEVDDFKKNINGVMLDLLKKFKELQFFGGESCDPDAMVAMCEYKDVNGEERPVLYFFKHGLEEESAKESVFKTIFLHCHPTASNSIVLHKN